MVALLFPYIFFEYLSGGFKYFLIFNPCLGKIPFLRQLDYLFFGGGYGKKPAGSNIKRPQRIELTFGRNMPDQHILTIGFH